jgi:hypothetical protein
MPRDWQVHERFGDGAKYIHRVVAKEMIAILSFGTDIGKWPDGKRWMHLSVSCQRRPPTFAEMRDAKDAFFGIHRYAVMVLPPEKFYVHQVGQNPNVLHLWATDDEWSLPEFSLGGGTL